jgi:hypothetical protein
MADQFDEFMEEVQTDIRHEQFMTLWKKYGKLAMVGVGAVVACVALWSMWSSYQLKQQLLVSQQYVMAQDLIANGKPEEALRQMALVSDTNHKVYALLAQFSKAALLTEGPTKDLAKAQEIYESIAKGSADPMYKDLALLQLVRVRMDALPESATQAQYEELLKVLENLTMNESSWRHFAMELKAVLLYKLNKITEATHVFVDLAQDTKTPESMRMRVRLMAQNLTSMAGTKQSS